MPLVSILDRSRIKYGFLNTQNTKAVITVAQHGFTKPCDTFLDSFTKVASQCNVVDMIYLDITVTRLYATFVHKVNMD